jgi:hypothetical protein
LHGEVSASGTDADWRTAPRLRVADVRPVAGQAHSVQVRKGVVSRVAVAVVNLQNLLAAAHSATMRVPS